MADRGEKKHCGDWLQKWLNLQAVESGLGQPDGPVGLFQKCHVNLAEPQSQKWIEKKTQTSRMCCRYSGSSGNGIVLAFFVLGTWRTNPPPPFFMVSVLGNRFWTAFNNCLLLRIPCPVTGILGHLFLVGSPHLICWHFKNSPVVTLDEREEFTVRIRLGAYEGDNKS